MKLGLPIFFARVSNPVALTPVQNLNETPGWLYSFICSGAIYLFTSYSFYFIQKHYESTVEPPCVITSP